jgi:hypothetical protein
MSSDQEFQSFLKKWRAALLVQSGMWEGPLAVGELARAGYALSPKLPDERISMLSFVRCDPEHRWRPRDMLSKVLAEVDDYKKQKRAWQKEFRAAELFLANTERNVGRRRANVADAQLKTLLGRTQNLIEQQRLAVRNLTEPARISPLGVWERLWQKNVRAEHITQEIGLDKRLQLQAAKMFRTFLHKDEGVSRRTIARLVVLVYSVTGLATYDKKKELLCILGSDREVTVRSVEEKLRRNGIH